MDDTSYIGVPHRADPAKLLGYLNFSDGRPDPKFQKGLADQYAAFTSSGHPAAWDDLPRWLAHHLAGLERAGSPAFADAAQARAVVAALGRLPAAYRAHHADLLAHQPDDHLFTPLFLARGAEAILQTGTADDTPDRRATAAVDRLNDYVGYRPMAVLETRPNTDYYPHEKVRPVPVYLKGAGAGPGRYEAVVRPALALLTNTDPGLLEEACFDPDKLDELSFDPRAHDHFHPVNKRPNVLFGEWDPHTIDGRGYYRRFVLRQMTLDTLLTWVDGPADLPGTAAERLVEAAAVMAGTVLMGAGVSGTGPNYHDSSVTLSKLVPRIARYRDGFYKTLLAGVPGGHGERLRAEAERRQQPFAGVRQFLNQAIATQRAAHLQDRRLAQLFAAMGYPQAARDRAKVIPAPAVRFATEMRVRQTEAEFAADKPDPVAAAKLLAEVEDLLRRGIDCGAVLDPWNILGHQGLFPIFPGREDTVRDPRAEELITLVGRQFDLYARAVAAAAMGHDPAGRERLLGAMLKFARWWDRFATVTVADLPRIHGGERAEAAEHVASALAAWADRPPGTTHLAFWRDYRDGFTSPAAFAQVITALVQHGEFPAAMGLLMTWLSESDTVPLEDPSASFDELAAKWLTAAVTGPAGPAADRPALVRRFFELLEANADDSRLTPDDWFADPDGPGPGRGSGPEFDSAYEGMTYKDSADDGEEGSVAGGDPPGPVGEFRLEAEADALEDKVKFLHTLASLWRAAARPELWADDPDTPADWLAAARAARAGLGRFLDRVTAVEVPPPSGGHEGMIEFDRRRAVRGHLLDVTVAAAVEVGRAARALAAVLPSRPELPASGVDAGPAGPDWEPVLVRLDRAVARRDPTQVRRLLPGFVRQFRHEPLLYCPPSDGGKPAEVMRAQNGPARP